VTYQFRPVDPEERAQYSGAPEPARRRSLIATVLAIGVMALFAAALWFAYEAGSHHTGPGGVPLIRADTSPTKVKPTSPDGMHVPDQNMLIYNEREPKVERLLPPPEQPMPRPAPPAAAAAPAAATPSASLAAPVTPAPTQPMTAPAAVQPAAAPPAAAPAPAAAAPPASAPAPAAPPKAAASETAKPAGEGVRVQLGALRSPDLAEREWARLKRANADILGSLSARPVRADLGEKGVFYRIEVGPLATPQAAARLCGELKERNVGCMLVR
jgi:cell division septation protein DedD